MNAVGKILVFLNLVFSFVVGAFAVMNYTARTHYADQNEKMRKTLTTLSADAAVYKGEADRLTRERNELDQKLKESIPKGGVLGVANIPPEKTAQYVAQALTKAQEQVGSQKRQIDDLNKDMEKQRQTARDADKAATIAVTDLNRAQAANKQLRGLLDTETDRTIQLTKEKNALRDDYVAASIQAKSLLNRNTQLDDELHRMAKELLRRSNGGSRPAGALAANANNPPPDNVEGLINFVDGGGKLVKLTIGSDSGLLKGHTMYVFGLNTGATGYRGRIKLVDVGAKWAVGEVMDRLQSKIQVGDTVAASILGKSR